MTCIRCGKNNSPNDRYCSNCGAILSTYSEPRGQKNIGIVIALGIILAFLIVVLVCTVICKYMIPPKNESDVKNNDQMLVLQRPEEEKAYIDKGDFEIDLGDEYEIGAEQTNISPEKQAIKDGYLSRAEEIQEYAQTYLVPATSQHEINSESEIVFKKWDALLNDVYQYLKTIMPASEFKALQEDEINWIVEKENAIEAAAAEWEGGSGEPMVRNGVATTYTEERCYYLISLIM